MAERGWGYWTEAKLDVLSSYLPAFVTASKRAANVVYLDLFAGSDTNHRRDTGNDLKGSAVRALEVLPEEAHVYFFELPRVASELDARLRERFPRHNFEVVAGDCNETLANVLERLKSPDLNWLPTFAFIDPYTSSTLHWDTLRLLADFKRTRPFKVELWFLFFGSNIPRVLGQRTSDNAEKVTRTFGCEDWLPIAQARDTGVLSAAEARYEYTNLMRWRLEHVLGYERTHTLQINNTSNAYLYDLIFATDNKAGDSIMRHVYNQALSRNEAMRRAASEIRREQRSGAQSLFGPEELASLTAVEPVGYRAEPPTQPFTGPDPVEDPDE